MTTIPLRHVGDVNPVTPEFDRLPANDEVTFMPLETVWADSRVDFSRRCAKAAVASGYTRFRDGDVLVPKVTPTFQAGRVVVAQLETQAGAGTTELHVIRARAGVSDARFLAYVCRSKPFLDEGVSAFQGVAGLQRVPDEFLRSFPIADIPLEEQRRIADFLDTETARLDQLMTLRDRQVTLLSERTSLGWQRVLDEQAGSDLVPLRRHLVSITDGPFGSSLKSSHYADGGARVIRLGNVGTGEFLDSDEAFISMDYFEELRAHSVRVGDVVVAGLGDSSRPVGRACVVPDLGAAIVKADCYRLRFDQAGLLHDYAALAISAPRVTSRTATLSRGSTRIRINTDVAREIAIPVPALSIQRHVAVAIAEMREESAGLRSALTSQVSLLRERRQALITAAVTGQIDVTTARPTDP